MISTQVLFGTPRQQIGAAISPKFDLLVIISLGNRNFGVTINKSGKFRESDFAIRMPSVM